MTSARRTSPAADNYVLKVPEIARLLSTCDETVRRLLRSGELAGFQIGERGGWRVARADLQAFIDARRRPATQ